MKKVILFITLFSMISLFSYSKNPVKQWGQLQVKGNQLCDQTGDPIVLRGVSYGWHNLWPRFYNKQSVKWLKKDWKCTVLRAAMGTVIEDNYIENPEFALKCMNKVIKAAIKNDLYIIIDWHTYYPQKEEAKAFFSMMAQKYGRIVNVSSVTGPVVSNPGEAAYSAAKAGVIGMSRALAIEVGIHGITVNNVLPGWIATASQTESEQAGGLNTPMKRSADPMEVANAIIFLASREASYITGVSLVVDGGNTIQKYKGPSALYY